MELLDTERHLALLAIEGKDLSLDLFADLEEILSAAEVLRPRHLGNMDKALDTRSDLDECAVVSHDDNLALDTVTDLEVSVKRIPRMRSELLETESDTLLLVVEIEDNDVDLLIERNDLLGMRNTTPREVGDVDKTVDTTKVNEYTVGGDILNSALEDLTLLELGDDLLLLLLELGLDKGLVRDDDIAELSVDLNNLELHGLADEDVVVADGLDIDLRTGEESLDTEYVNNHTTLGTALDVTLNDLVVLESCIDAVPCTDGACFLVRELKLTVLVLLILYVDLYLVTDLEIGIVAELVTANDAVRLEADINDDLALVEGDYDAIDNVLLLERRESLVILSLLLSLLCCAAGDTAILKGIPIEIFDALLHFTH